MDKEISIWIRPRETGERQITYRELKDRPDIVKDLREKVFLPAKAYPKRRGRRAKYDHLLISIVGITEEKAGEIAKYLWKRFNRPIVVYAQDIHGENGNITAWRFFLAWRDRKTGKSIRTGRGVFKNLRIEILKIIHEGEIEEEKTTEAPQGEEKKITHKDMAKSEVAHAEKEKSKKAPSPKKEDDFLKELDEVANVLKEEEGEKREAINKIEKMAKTYLEWEKKLDELEKDLKIYKKKANSILATKSDRLKAQKKAEKLELERRRIKANMDRIDKDAEKIAKKHNITEEEIRKIVERE